MLDLHTRRLSLHGDEQTLEGSSTYPWMHGSDQIVAKARPLSPVQKHGGALHPRIQTTLKDKLARVDSAAKGRLRACTRHGRARPERAKPMATTHGTAAATCAAAGTALTATEDLRELRDGRSTRGSP